MCARLLMLDKLLDVQEFCQDPAIDGIVCWCSFLLYASTYYCCFDSLAHLDALGIVTCCGLRGIGPAADLLLMIDR